MKHSDPPANARPTLHIETGAASETTIPPRTEWGKYRLERFQGAGGMGQVYKAYDTELCRSVALKLLRCQDADAVTRFKQEAKAQARVEHEHICKIYEVGEFEGTSFIAMQYIDGMTLPQAQAEMSLEQKVRVIKEVAEALQEAHKRGLIHRDVKPSNIMIEKTESGEWKPYVLDFGLAKEMDAPGLTATGILIGTPNYMAPEQVMGEIHKLDRRTDIYGLGATFYELLTGKAPFEAESSVTVLLMTINEDAPPVRSLNQHVPIDLEAVAMKCLEKNPLERYDSARALAEDLDRYLAGDPVIARRLSRTYALMKKARKHKWLVGASGLMALILLAALVMVVRVQMNAAEQVRVANAFGQEVERIEAFARQAYLLPKHDVRYVRQIVEKKMERIRDRMRELGEFTEGPGHYALGRGYLALKDHKRGLEHLKAAWDENGYREPVVAYALGLALVEGYREELAEAERIQNRDIRDARLKQLEREYREPARKYLDLGMKPWTSSGEWFDRVEGEYVEGLIAYVDKDHQKVLQRMRSLVKRAPWMYEGHALMGDAYLALANRSRAAGDYAQALSTYQEAEEAYRIAGRQAESDPDIYERLCATADDVMLLQVYETGESPEQWYRNGLQFCADGLQVDADNADLWIKRAQIIMRWGEYELRRGDDPRTSCSQAVESAHQASKIRQDEYAYTIIGKTYSNQGEYESQRGLDPKDSFEKAIRNLEKALSLAPNSALTLQHLGGTYWRIAFHEQERGGDPRPHFQKSIGCFERQLALHESPVIHYNIAIAYTTMAGYDVEQSRDPGPAIQKALPHFKIALAANAKDSMAHSNLGLAYYSQGRYELSRGRDSQNSFQKAVQEYEEAVSINPNYALAYNNLGDAHLLMGISEAERGRHPGSLLQKAIDSYRKALEINPGLYDSFGGLSYAYLEQARFELLQAHNPMKTLQSAIQHSETAVRINPGYATGHQVLGQAYLLMAEYAFESGGDALGSLEKAGYSLRKASTINPNSAVIYLDLGRLEEAYARVRAARRQSWVDSLQASRTWLKKAIELDANLAGAWMTIGETYRWQAEWNPALPDWFPQGINALEKALSLNPRLAEARALQGALWLFKAQGNPEEQHKAHALLTEALQMNPLLERKYRLILQLQTPVKESR